MEEKQSIQSVRNQSADSNPNLKRKSETIQNSNIDLTPTSPRSTVKHLPQQKLFQNHYVWPERFVARECRSDSELIEPISIAEFSNKTKKNVFGQIVEAREPKENSNGTWNFHFIVGKNGDWFNLGFLAQKKK